MKTLLFVGAALAAAGLAQPQMTIEEYEPKSTLVVPQHPVTRAKYPFIDVHNHQRDMSKNAVDKLIRDMDSINLRVMVNLSGGSGATLRNIVESMKGRYPDRLRV